jgi:hypothetical protein
MIKRIGFFALFLLATVPATAASKQYGVIGIGNRSCGSWIADRKEAGFPALVDLAWVEGFLTAMDHENGKVNASIHKTDADGIAAWVDNYCAAHPLNDLSRASEELAISLSNKR